MKTYFIISLCLVIGISCATAQVTIGSSIPPSKGALLDLKEFAKDDQTTSTKGLALPRVQITDLNSLSDIAGADLSEPKAYTGLIVYMPKKYKAGNLCTNAVEIPQALYVWTGSKWISLGDQPTEHSVDPSEIVDKGKDGNISWLLKKDGQLIVCGDGPMTNYPNANAAPWMRYSSRLKSLLLDEGITTIGKRAFMNCSNLTSNLTIPNSVTSIEEFAFYSCFGFTGHLIIPNSVTSIAPNAFYNCRSFGNLTIGNSVRTIGKNAFNNCQNFTGSLNLPNSLTTIENAAFERCYGFTGNLTIPNSMTTIGDYAFRHCTGIDGILTIPNTIETIGREVFRNTPLITIINCYAPSSAFSGAGIFASNKNLNSNIDKYETARDMHIPSDNASDYPQATWTPMNITIKVDLP